MENHVFPDIGKTLSWTLYFFYLTFKKLKSCFSCFYIYVTGSQPYWISASCQPCLFTSCISCQPYWFYNFTQLLQFYCEMELKVDLWLDYSYFVFGMNQYTLLPIDFNGKLGIFLKHLKKKNFFFGVHVCVIGLWLFFRKPKPYFNPCQLCCFLKKKKIFLLCTSTQITLKFFHVNMYPHVLAMLDFKKKFWVKPCVDN